MNINETTWFAKRSAGYREPGCQQNSASRMSHSILVAHISVPEVVGARCGEGTVDMDESQLPLPSATASSAVKDGVPGPLGHRDQP